MVDFFPRRVTFDLAQTSTWLQAIKASTFMYPLCVLMLIPFGILPLLLSVVFKKTILLLTAIQSLFGADPVVKVSPLSVSGHLPPSECR